MPCSSIRPARFHLAKFLAPAVLGLSVACTPALDWREARPEGANLLLMFPCKPASDVRNLEMQDRVLPVHLHACKTVDQNFALSYVDVGDPALVGPALKQMRESLAAKLSPQLPGQASSAKPLAVQGMTPNPQALTQLLSGQLPDGSAVRGVVAVFARGTVVYQAVVLGTKHDAAAQETFVSGIRFVP